jgi:hypothetical protein
MYTFLKASRFQMLNPDYSFGISGKKGMYCIARKLKRDDQSPTVECR